jgi:hypothetical protein
MYATYANRWSAANQTFSSLGLEVLDVAAFRLSVDNAPAKLAAAGNRLLLRRKCGGVAERAEPRMTPDEHVHGPSPRSADLIRAVGDGETLVRGRDQMRSPEEDTGNLIDRIAFDVAGRSYGPGQGLIQPPHLQSRIPTGRTDNKSKTVGKSFPAVPSLPV